MTDTKTAWLSKGFEVLMERITSSQTNTGAHFDVVIIGSGYGGAIAASRLAGKHSAAGRPLTIAVLERGREYLPGMFPTSMSTLPGHTRFSNPLQNRVVGNRDGLFDIRPGADINALVANGLGGGSLINAGVMARPSESVFDKRWPSALREVKALDSFYNEVTLQLGAKSAQPLTTLDKYQALQRLAQGNADPAEITVALVDGDNNSNVSLRACNACGDCATGCNQGAKDSLDVNLLVEAKRGGVEIFTGATVLRIGGQDHSWTIEAIPTEPQLAKRAGVPTCIRAARVILAAGTFGSTEILLRSRQKGLRVSRQLGERFSGNGDMLAVGFGQHRLVNAVADETTAWGRREVGPTITGIIDLRENVKDGDFPMVIEEMAVPGPLRRVFEELFTTVSCLQEITRADWSGHSAGLPSPDPLAVDPTIIERSSIYAVMGDDGAAGRIALRDGFEASSDASVVVQWPQLGQHPLFPAQIATLERLAAESGCGGTVIANPLWRPLPDALDEFVNGQRGALMTVHPLGGCAMADDARTGVVNHCGQVFTGSRTTPTEVYETLVVMDGSVMPSALGINPALTIAAVAARACEELIAAWKLQRPHDSGVDSGVEVQPDQFPKRDFRERPRFREDVQQPDAQTATRMEFVERLRGSIRLDTPMFRHGEYQAELTLHFEPKVLRELFGSSGDRTLTVASGDPSTNQVSRLRLFKKSDWEETRDKGYSGRELEDRLEQLSVFTAPLSGTLTIMGREPTSVWSRVWSALRAWVPNRGVRDIWQAVREFVRGMNHKPPSGILPLLRLIVQLPCNVYRYIVQLLRTLSHAGEVRLFEYELALGRPLKNSIGLSTSRPAIRATKHISYRRRGNPLDQLSRASVSVFPGLLDEQTAMLTLVPEFLARDGLPLFRIVKQQDSVQALADLVSLGAYFLRLLLSIHLYSFRMPDADRPRAANRLPGLLPGLPPPECLEIPIEHDIHNTPGNAGAILLTRYRGRKETSPPVLLIHGYSASGTTFAHPALDADLARHLWDRGRDIWILDMRSSCGSKTATVNYSFEQLAATDIPVAVQEVCRATGREAIDIVAHCMGAAMFSMAVLDPNSSAAGGGYQMERRALPGRVRRAVLSQVGPLVSLAPANIFRAYLFTYLKNWLPLGDYSFSPNPGTSAVEQLLDRLLSATPYTDEEFDLENPVTPWKRTPWVRARHRMDLLYGRTFALANMSESALAHLDDFFGPLSVETATQVAHFARYQTITNQLGYNNYVSRSRLRKYWRFPTLSLHGRENGLADVATVQRMETILGDAGCNFRRQVFESLGHQDCFIGKNALPVFQAIECFLAEPAGEQSPVCLPERDPMLVQVPWSGPVIYALPDARRGTELPVSFGCNPALSAPRLVLVIPLARGARQRYQLIQNGSTVLCQVHPAPAFVDGWAKMLLPQPADTAVHSLLLLLAYDEAPQLDNSLFGNAEELIDEEGFEQLDWRETLAASDAQRILDGRDGPRTRKLARAVEERLVANADDLRPGIVRVPRQRENVLCVALGSCQYPPGILDQKPGYLSYRRLAARLETQDEDHRPELLLLMGDQIYVDATAGLADAVAQDERYVIPYQNFFRARHVRSVLRQLPATMVMDDHEIDDNWQPLDYLHEKNETALELGRKHYLNFQRGRHMDGKPLYFTFEYNGFAFFVADTRTAREPRTVSNAGTRCILGKQQREALDAWFRERARIDPARPAFFISSAMFAPRWRRALENDHAVVHSDGWEGYPASFNHVLQQVARRGLQHLVLISGDAHLSCDATMTLNSQVPPLILRSVHASSLFAPYPFANSLAEDLQRQEPIVVTRQCGAIVDDWIVDTAFNPGDGFALLQVSQVNGQWKVDLSFDREAQV